LGTRTPEEERLDLDAFFLQIMRLPKAAQALQCLPNPSQTVDGLITARSKSPVISRDFGDEYAPAGSRTLTTAACPSKANTNSKKQGNLKSFRYYRTPIFARPWPSFPRFAARFAKNPPRIFPIDLPFGR
jgi:hypothetical protein